MGRPLAPLAAICITAWSCHSAAESRAEQLFNKGLEAFLAGRHAEGCPLIQQSHQLEPLAGVLFTLAECQQGWGKLKTANDTYAKFLTAVGQLPAAKAEKHADRVAVALRKRAAIAPKVPTVTVALRGELPTGGKVLLDDQDISADLGRPISVDPGTHSIRLTSPDGDLATASVDLAVGAKRSVELDSSGATPVQEDIGVDTETAPPNTTAWVLGGVGVLGLVVGSATGLMASSKKQTIDDNCPNRTCNAEGRDAVDSAQSLGLVSTISFGVGIVGISAATYLFLTAKDGKEESAMQATSTPRPGIWVTPKGGQVSLSGSF